MSKKMKKLRPLKQIENIEDLAEKPLFLHEAIDIKVEETEVYNIKKELNASKKNRSIPVHTAIVSFTLLLLGATIWLTHGIQKDIDRTSVGIADFRDINLQELLNSLRNAEHELNKVEDKMSLVRDKMRLEIEKIKYQSALEIKKVEESGIGQAEKRRLIRSIQAKNDRNIGERQKIHKFRIREKEKEAKAARLRLETYKKQVSRNQADYDKDVKRKLTAFRRDTDTRVFKIENIYKERTIAHEAKMKEQKREYQAHLKKYDKELKAAREDFRKAAGKNVDTEKLLNCYRRALVYYAKSRGEHGYVIDPGSKGGMLVDVNPFINLKKGDRAYVLNKENKVAALVELRTSGRRIRAKIVKRMITGAIQPFDKILLKKN